ncbi:MAG: glutamate-1-semialdehyde 2,1-aminomutase [Bacteroidia bacterium]|nr:MAG: glutamate-1-semialdehyde 2,1-aminomutase [Bacteroidia bacterium]
MIHTKSEELYKKALQLFPGGVNSPVRAFKSVGGTPIFIEKGKGSKIYDVDGNEYIDYCASWGPLILGHAHPDIINAAYQAMMNGTSFGAPTKLENQLAELILNHHPYIEKIRFVSSGTEAVMSAIRLARAYTGKNKIIKFEGCYHGHSDSLLVKAGSGLVTFGQSSSAGVPKEIVQHTIVLQLDDESAVQKAFEEFGNDIAAIIIEPIPANNGLLLQRKEYLQFLRDITKQHNCLLIFDEVISGFRVGFTGAAGYYNISPDIITFGKIIGGGFPVGAYAASKEIMRMVSPEGPMYQAGTLSGNPVAMAAGYAQLSRCLEDNFYTTLEEKTKTLIDGILQVKPEVLPFKIFSIGSIFWIAFAEREYIRSANEIDANSMNYFRTLYHALLKNGVYLGPSGYEVGFLSAVHTNEDIERTVLAFEKAFKEMLVES